MTVFADLAGRAHAVKREPQTPWYARLVVAGCVAYALTPVDFVPDAIPVVGFIDDLIFIPLAIAFAVRFIPAPAWLAIGAAWFAAVALIALWTVR